eukprot:m.34652 g.34652  ORF g.34652 m.34652 type:complete len:220 (+) comp15541_c0_seq1:136-795(+)
MPFSEQLQAAIDKGDPNKFLEVLQTSDFKINDVYNGSWTPLYYCAFKNNHVMIRWLLQHFYGEIDVDRGEPDSGWTPLMQATFYGHTLSVRVLCEEGVASVNSRTKMRRTAFMIARVQKLAIILWEYGSDPDCVDEDGRKAVHRQIAYFPDEDRPKPLPWLFTKHRFLLRKRCYRKYFFLCLLCLRRIPVYLPPEMTLLIFESMSLKDVRLACEGRGND